MDSLNAITWESYPAPKPRNFQFSLYEIEFFFSGLQDVLIRSLLVWGCFSQTGGEECFSVVFSL